ncbi:MAG: hypothetical protein K1X71_06335 [Pirellulales bacterium]|nr:hypothetical protein [Pirellulales bacterium]
MKKIIARDTVAQRATSIRAENRAQRAKAARKKCAKNFRWRGKFLLQNFGECVQILSIVPQRLARKTEIRRPTHHNKPQSSDQIKRVT